MPTHNIRQNGSWAQGTVYHRQNGSWVQVGGGSGGGTAGWDWQDPPSRSSTVYHSNVGGSIQNAVNGLSSDTELILDDGPYTEEFDIPNTDSITISGGSNGATINNPQNSTSQVSGGGWSSTDTSCSAIAEGDTVLSVGDASVFSAGDDLLIHDSTDVYKNMTSSDLRNTYDQYKGEFCVVDSVDTSNDTVTLTSGTHQHYDDPNGALEARNPSFDLQDFHWHNITLDGGRTSPNEDTSDSDFRGLSINYSKNIWITDSTFQNYHKDGFSNNMVLHEYVDNSHAENFDRYGFSHSDGATHVRIRDSSFADFHSYGVQCGGGATDKPSVPAPTYDIMALRCHGDNSMRSDATWVGDAHFGAERVEYIDCTTNSCRGMKIRGFDQHLIGDDFDAGGSTLVQTTQIVGQSSIENLYCTNGSRGWLIWPKEGHPITDITMEDCQFENMSATPFRFRDDENGNLCDVDNLQVINSSWNGDWIDDQMIENSDGDGTGNVDYTTTYPTDQTPAEYFG